MNMTVLELFKDKLPSNYVIAIISNMTDKSILDLEAGKLLDELEEAFDWSISNEGYQLWADIYDSIAQGLALPDLPITVAWLPSSFISTETGNFLLNVHGSRQDLMIQFDFNEKADTVEEQIFKEKYYSFVN